MPGTTPCIHGLLIYLSMQPLYALIKPAVTEKATALSDKFTYTFWVNRKATKIDIKNAIYVIYGTKVDKVRIINLPGKKRVLRRHIVEKRPEMKKALITLVGRKKLGIEKMAKIKE